MNIRAADGRQGNPDYGFPDAGARSRHFFDADVVWSVKNVGFHCLHV
jgi:hypothetical protein